MSPRVFTWVFVFATVAAFAVGTINIMRLRVEADTMMFLVCVSRRITSSTVVLRTAL